MVPSLEGWLLKAEGVLPPLHSELRDARAMLRFCHFARQEYTQATAVYEKIAETEWVCFPLYSYHRINALMHLVKCWLCKVLERRCVLKRWWKR